MTIKVCRVCGSSRFHRLRESTIPADLGSDHFAITDDQYGCTGAIDGCQECGFQQCLDLTDVTAFYEGLEDHGYEDSREPRILQMDLLLQTVFKRLNSKPATLLDVGAGSGILVESAKAMGIEAQGIEPSTWLAEQARARDLAVTTGVLPQESLSGPFDLVTCIDVIEHVEDPIGMVQTMNEVMAEDGLCVVVTPDVKSLAAKFMGERWWHYRIAHIGYFEDSTLNRLMTDNGFVCQHLWRPSWYFQIDYLAKRLGQYLPFDPSKLLPHVIGQRVVPLNLFDSIIGIYARG